MCWCERQNERETTRNIVAITMYAQQARLHRALEQNIILLHETIDVSEENKLAATYRVQGASGSEYTVTVSDSTVPTCTCPDFSTRGRCCKHIFFVFMNALNCPRDDVLSVVSHPADVAHLLDHRRQATGAHRSAAVANEDKKRENGPAERRDWKECECPICLEEFCEEDAVTKGRELIYCSVECGNNVHSVCWKRWSKATGNRICPYCRAAWR